MKRLSVFTRSRQSFLVGVALLTLAGLCLRLFRLGNQSLWVDEVNAVVTAQAPLKGIYLRSALASNSLPTYFVLLKPFVSTSGVDLEFRARLLSVIAGALSVPVFIGVVFLWRQRRGMSLLAGTLLAVNPLHLWYSQEARGYSVMLLFGLLAFLCFELARQKKQVIWWILYLLAALMAIALHKTGLIFPVACGLWHLREIVKRQGSLKSLLIHAPIAIATLAMLALKSYPPPAGYGRSARGLEIGYTFLTFVGGYSFGPSVTDIQSHGSLAAISTHAFETGILLAVLLALAFLFAINFRRLLVGREIQLLFLAVGVVSIYALISGFPYNVRYALPALFGFLALIAVFAGELYKSSFVRLSVAGVLAVSLWADAQWFYIWQYRKGDSRAVAQWLVQHQERIQSWMVLPEYMNSPLEWYLKPFPKILANEIPPTSDRSTTFPPLPDVLILTRRHHLADPDKVIASYANSAHGTETVTNFAAFELYVNDLQNAATNHEK
jgi:hypothetical protein